VGGLLHRDANGSFTASSQRFAYDTANGDLFYSASGSSSNKHLIAALDGHPGLNPAHILFMS
ncbi:MAG: hypothetical protein ACREET_18905, partial [Stellaceae bacterium]